MKEKTSKSALESANWQTANYWSEISVCKGCLKESSIQVPRSYTSSIYSCLILQKDLVKCNCRDEIMTQVVNLWLGHLQLYTAMRCSHFHFQCSFHMQKPFASDEVFRT